MDAELVVCWVRVFVFFPRREFSFYEWTHGEAAALKYAVGDYLSDWFVVCGSNDWADAVRVDVEAVVWCVRGVCCVWCCMGSIVGCTVLQGVWLRAQALRLERREKKQGD